MHQSSSIQDIDHDVLWLAFSQLARGKWQLWVQNLLVEAHRLRVGEEGELPMPESLKSVEVRGKLVDALRLDLAGPSDGPSATLVSGLSPLDLIPVPSPLQ
jgi:hypothetical protein